MTESESKSKVSRKYWLTIGGKAYALDFSGLDKAEVIGNIKGAIERGEYLEVAVLDGDNCPMVLLIRGQNVDTAVLDPGLDPKPSEIG